MDLRFRTETGQLHRQQAIGLRFVNTSRRAIGLALTTLLLLMGPLVGAAGAEPREVLVVGTSGDYEPFSLRNDEAGSPPAGFSPEIARAYAKDRDLELRFVAFAWPELLADLSAGRFDIAMGGITVRPERSLAGRFSVPVATSGAMLIVAARSSAAHVAEFDRAGLRIAVNKGGHLERVARQHFAKARIVAIPDNTRVLSALLEGRVDAAVTDTLEAPHWLEEAPGLRAMGPFTRDRKALLTRADLAERALDLDRWLIAREADGTLARMRARYLGTDAGQQPTALPLPALIAAIDERLALMPAVAESKRKSGAPVEVPEREARVVQAALDAVRRALDFESTGGSGPKVSLTTTRENAIRALVRAQIEAAKTIQRNVLAHPPAPQSAPAPDLDRELRPALIRIGDRIAHLVLVLPGGLDEKTVRSMTQSELSSHHLPEIQLEALTRALLDLCRAGGVPAPAGTQ